MAAHVGSTAAARARDRAEAAARHDALKRTRRQQSPAAAEYAGRARNRQRRTAGRRPRASQSPKNAGCGRNSPPTSFAGGRSTARCEDQRRAAAQVRRARHLPAGRPATARRRCVRGLSARTTMTTKRYSHRATGCNHPRRFGNPCPPVGLVRALVSLTDQLGAHRMHRLS